MFGFDFRKRFVVIFKFQDSPFLQPSDGLPCPEEEFLKYLKGKCKQDDQINSEPLVFAEKTPEELPEMETFMLQLQNQLGDKKPTDKESTKQNKPVWYLDESSKFAKENNTTDSNVEFLNAKTAVEIAAIQTEQHTGAERQT